MTTTLNVKFRYAQHPTENTMRAVADLYDVYGIRRVRLDQPEQTVLVEYDATRLGIANVFQLLRRAGLAVTEEVSPFPPPPPTLPEEEKSPAV
jgi:hypothetical protein